MDDLGVCCPGCGYAEVIGRLKRQHPSTECLAFLGEIDTSVPADVDSSDHGQLGDSQDRQGQGLACGATALPHPLHAYLGSWLNLIERFFSTLGEKWIKRKAYTSVKNLAASIERYPETYNPNPKTLRWHKQAEDILASVARAARALGN